MSLGIGLTSETARKVQNLFRKGQGDHRRMGREIRANNLEWVRVGVGGVATVVVFYTKAFEWVEREPGDVTLLDTTNLLPVTEPGIYLSMRCDYDDDGNSVFITSDCGRCSNELLVRPALGGLEFSGSAEDIKTGFPYIVGHTEASSTSTGQDPDWPHCDFETPPGRQAGDMLLVLAFFDNWVYFDPTPGVYFGYPLGVPMVKIVEPATGFEWAGGYHGYGQQTGSVALGTAPIIVGKTFLPQSLSDDYTDKTLRVQIMWPGAGYDGNLYATVRWRVHCFNIRNGGSAAYGLDESGGSGTSGTLTGSGATLSLNNTLLLRTWFNRDNAAITAPAGVSTIVNENTSWYSILVTQATYKGLLPGPQQSVPDKAATTSTSTEWAAIANPFGYLDP